MSQAREERAVPVADDVDAAEQEVTVDGSPEIRDRRVVVGEEPEADVLEQEEVAAEHRVRLERRRPDDVPEADWLEQSVVEVEDEDEVR
jgi:hypothetical protein